ncbi:MAG TPA: hypothetical protein VNJ01_02760 [Bacteriovoracaceae bacterium]|nr:hypothetical protein [Bacteriovoracaceae bacterium]
MSLLNLSLDFSPAFLRESNLHKSLGEEFCLSGNGNMVFHWADFDETCDAVKAQMESDPDLFKDYQLREAGLAKLARIPVWVRTNSKVVEISMYDLYDKYITNQLLFSGGIDPFKPLEVSCISSTGPFKGMSVVECFNKSTYKDFVLVHLLKGKLPRRNFRIRLKSKILAEYGPGFNAAQVVSLEQLTMDGLLLSMEAESFTDKISTSGRLRFLLDTKMLKECLGKSPADLETHLSRYAFNLLYSAKKEDSCECSLSDFSIQSSFDFLKSKQIFLFISYQKLAQNNPGCVENLQNFVSYTRELVRDHYSQLGTSKLRSA